MSESHLAYLSLGSNIHPETNLVEAIALLGQHGRVEKISNAWESKSLGAEGPNYLNACLSYRTRLKRIELKEQILLPIELQLGRSRTDNKFVPRTIDIDIVIFDDKAGSEKFWNQAFVVLPLAEIYPTYRNPVTRETIQETAARLRQDIWMEVRPEVLRSFGGLSSRL